MEMTGAALAETRPSGSAERADEGNDLAPFPEFAPVGQDATSFYSSAISRGIFFVALAGPMARTIPFR